MLSPLLLAVSLLGTVSASHPAPAGPEVTALEGPEGTRCPLAGETQALDVPDPRGATALRYVIVTRCQTFHSAQRVCSRCFGGRLASVHSLRANVLLCHRARLCTRRGRLWIGAVTRPQGRTVRCRWSDRSRWDFSRWQRGHPRGSRRFCTALCTRDGHWRSVRCRTRLPFICEF